MKRRQSARNVEAKKKVKTENKEEFEEISDHEVQERQGKEKEDEFEEFDGSQYNLSELEIKRRENMKKNMALFEEFQINQAKHEIKENLKPKLAVVGLKSVKREKKIIEPLPRRTSLRIQKIAADAELPMTYKEPSYSSLVRHDYHFQVRKAETINMVEEEGFSEIIKTWEDEQQKVNTDSKPIEFSKYSKSINKLSVTHCGKVGKSRICSEAVHPTVNKTIAAFGDKEGHLGIWDVGSNIKCNGYPASEEVLLFEPHCSPIKCLKFKNTDCNHLVSCSYDGTLRQADFVAQKFTQIYAFTDEDVRLYHFSNPLYQPNVYLTATSEGSIAVIDSSSGKVEQSYPLFKKNTKCVDCHPLDGNLFTAVGPNGVCGIWDLRKMKSNGDNKPISFYKATKTGNSVFFSPGQGNKLLYTAYDNYIRIFDVEAGGKLSSKPSWTINHDNHTGRWLTSFQAVWDPKTEDSFVIGSMGHPRKLDVYGCLDNNRVEWIRLLDENFTTVGSINAFHPTKNVLVSGNASGKAYVWT